MDIPMPTWKIVSQKLGMPLTSSRSLSSFLVPSSLISVILSSSSLSVSARGKLDSSSEGSCLACDRASVSCALPFFRKEYNVQIEGVFFLAPP